MHASDELNFENPERLPPQNMEAEEAVLGSILIDPEALGRVRSVVTPEMFYTPAHRVIYQAAEDLSTRGNSIDVLTLAQYLLDHNKLDRVGGRATIERIASRVVSAANVDQHALLVKNKSLRRSIISTGHRFAELGYDTARPLADVLDDAESSLFRITQRPPQGDLVSTSDILIDTFAEIEFRSTGNFLPGLNTGFYDFDEMTLGLQRSDLIVCGARPSMGKTSLCLQIAQYIASNYKLPVAIFSLEMSKIQLVYRLLSSSVEIESSRLRGGRIAGHEWEKVGLGVQMLSSLPLYIDDTPDISVNEIRSRSRRFQAQQGKPLGLILIDYIQLMEGPGENRVLELSKITRQLKGLARELDVPVLALSQLSRAVESRSNKRPMMSDLRESGSIEQDADLAVFLYRDDYYDPSSPCRGEAEIIIGKSRNGPTGTTKLLFDSQYTKFRNISTVAI